VEWARECNEILSEHGAVTGSIRYPVRHKARWRAQALIRLLVELRMRERWEVAEHTEEVRPGEYAWTVELKGGNTQ
jgi:hypothetical protein